MGTVKFLCFDFPAVYHCDCTTDWFSPLDNQEVIKKSLRKCNLGFFEQWVTFTAFTMWWVYYSSHLLLHYQGNLSMLKTFFC